MMGRRYQPEQLAVDVLTGAGLTAGVKIPYPRPDRFLRLFLVRGDNLAGIIRTDLLELESWATRPTSAWEQLLDAFEALEAAAGTRGIRRVVEDAGPTSLPTGEDGWERYRMLVAIETRP